MPGLIAECSGRKRNSTLQKMENRGNEAKKSLKTKKVTLFDVAHCVRFCALFGTNRGIKRPNAVDFEQTYRSVTATTRRLLTRSTCFVQARWRVPGSHRSAAHLV
jgi:hypothetical protein